MTETEHPIDYMYSPALVAFATFLGAPVAGSILLAHNYRSLGKPSVAKQVMLWGTLGTVLILVIAYLLPEKFPDSILPIAYTAAIHQAAKHYQGTFYDDHIANGGAKGSVWRTIGIGLGCLCAILVVVFVVVLVTQPDQP